MEYKEISTKKLKEEILENDSDFNEFYKLWNPLSKFLTDYNHLKALNKLTQVEIAKKMETTQSAISRLNRMKGKPSYTLLQKISEAVGGELFITPLAEMTATLPYDLHEPAKKCAELLQTSVTELMVNTFREALNNNNYINSIASEGAGNILSQKQQTEHSTTEDLSLEQQKPIAGLVNCPEVSDSNDASPFELAS